MIHYTCDRCKQKISSVEVRYLLKLEVQAIADSEETIATDDFDSLSELHQLLEGIQCEEDFSDPIPASQANYDLCPRCYQQFSRNPLGREIASAIGFSNN